MTEESLAALALTPVQWYTVLHEYEVARHGWEVLYALQAALRAAADVTGVTRARVAERVQAARARFDAAEAACRAARVLHHWVILERPKDDPAHYLLVRWTIGPGWMVPDRIMARASTLDALRPALPLGLTRIGPHAGDDPVILEVWM